MKPQVSLNSISNRITNSIEEDTTTLFTDGAWRDWDRASGCGCVLYNTRTRDSRQGSSTELFVASTLMAEALAVPEALLQAKALQISNICLKSDNQVFITALNSKQHLVELYGINLDIEHLSSSFTSLSFSYVPRRFNSVAFSLAKSALFSANPVLLV